MAALRQLHGSEFRDRQQVGFSFDKPDFHSIETGLLATGDEFREGPVRAANR